MSWDKKADLLEVQAAGKRCLREYDQCEFRMKEAQNSIALIGSRIAACDRALAQLLASKPTTDDFADERDLAAWQQQMDELNTARAQFIDETTNLRSIAAQNQLAAVKLARQIEALRRSAHNLGNVVAGRDPAEGWTGGVFLVPS